jgi:hypothetical protein
MRSINGFPNRFYNWGGEDDAIRERVFKKYGKIVRLYPTVGRYWAKCHELQQINNQK